MKVRVQSQVPQERRVGRGVPAEMTTAKGKTASKRAVEDGDSGSEGEIGFGSSFTFDYQAGFLHEPIQPAAPGRTDVLAGKIEEVRAARMDRIAELPERGALVGSDDDGDSDGVEITVDSDICDGDDDDDDEDGLDDEPTAQEGLIDPKAPIVESFAELNLSKPILKALSALGFTKPTPIQAASIPVALAGKDICGGAVTGSGKTAAFMLPILERLLHRSRRGPASIKVLVLLPTRELCVQCHKVAQDLARFTDVKVVLIAGGLPMKPQEAELRLRPEIVIATPGRLIDHLTNSPSFSLDSIEILVLDEADRMLEDGFADELDEIIKHTPKKRQTMMFSATMTDKIEDLIRLSLDKPVKLFVDHSDTIARKLVQEFIRVREDREEDRLPIVMALCKRTLTERCILFFPTKELAHRVRIILGLLGLNAAELHGGLAQADRLAALESFRSGTVDLLVATDVAARGLDIPEVRFVLNYNMPLNYKQYVHRIGRTARAGASGRSITLVGEGTDRKILRQVLKNSSETLQHRIIAKETIIEYRRLLDDLETDLQAILESEKEDRSLEKAEREVRRAENLLKHKDDIKARPAKGWFQSGKQKTQSKRKEQRTN